MYLEIHAWIRSPLSVSWMSNMCWTNGNCWFSRRKRKHLSEWFCEINHRILNSHTTPLVNRIRVYLLATEFIGVFCPCYVLSFSCGETGCVCVCVSLVFRTLFIEGKRDTTVRMKEMSLNLLSVEFRTDSRACNLY